MIQTLCICGQIPFSTLFLENQFFSYNMHCLFICIFTCWAYYTFIKRHFPSAKQLEYLKEGFFFIFTMTVNLKILIFFMCHKIPCWRNFFWCFIHLDSDWILNLLYWEHACCPQSSLLISCPVVEHPAVDFLWIIAILF